MQSPVDKIRLLQIVRHIDGTEGWNSVLQVLAEQTAFDPLREYPQLLESLKRLLVLELECLKGVADKKRKFVLKRKADVDAFNLQLQRDKAYDDYEIIRRLVAPEEKQLKIDVIRFSFV